MAASNNVGRQFELEFTECKVLNGKIVYECQHCDYKSNTKSKLVTHNYRHTGQRPFSCSFDGCKSSFSRQECLNTHLLIHLGKKPFICNLCGKAFRQKGILYHHIRTHTGEKPYSCNFLDCGYTCKTSSQLAVHRRIHSGHKPFICNFSDCRFSSASSGNLKLHEKIHTGKKPYKCDFPDCQYASAFSNYKVKVHKRIHSGEKPFMCGREGCHFASTQSSNLRRHERIHSDEKLYKCDYEGCPYATNKTAHLRRHIRQIHSGEKPFRCDYEGCLFASADPCSLRRHKKNHAKASAGDRDPKLCLSPVVILSDVLNDSETVPVYAPHLNLRNSSNHIYDGSICTDDVNAVPFPHINDIARNCNNQLSTSWPTEIGILEEHNCGISTQLDDVDTTSDTIIQNSTNNNWTEDKEIQGIETADRKPKKQSRVCKLCSFKTKKLKKFLTHLQEHREKNEFFCSLCDFVCVGKELLRSHWLTHHNDIKDSDSENDLSRDQELVNFNVNVNVNCSSGSGSESKLEVKEDSYFLETSSTSAKNSTSSHGNKSKEQKTGTVGSKLFRQESEVCANFIDRKQVYKHYTITYYFSSVVHFSCHFCGKEFSKEMKVLNHLRHHTGQRLPTRAFSPH